MFSFAQNYLTRGFWGDEAWTSLISQLPYQQMLKTTAADFHPPGYYTAVELLYRFLSPGEITTRLVSMLFWCLTIFFVYLLAGKFKGKTFGLSSALVVGFNPIFFRYSFEARNYTMFAFAATASVYFLLRLLEKFSIKNAAIFVIFTALGIYTHYYMFFILAAQGLYILILERRFVLKFVGVYFVIFLLYLPWVPFLFGQLTSVGQSYWIGVIDTRTHWEALQRILSGEMENVFRPFLILLSVSMLLAGLWHHLAKRKFEKPYVLIWLWAIVPFVLATLPGLKVFEFKLPFRPIFFWRYLIGASVPLSMVIVHSAQRLPFRLYLPVVVAIVTLSLAIDFLTLGSYPPTFKQTYQNEILGKINSEDKIVTVLPSFAEVLYYRNYFGLKNDVIVLPEGLVQFSGKSLLDAYAAGGVVTIGQRPAGRYFELTPGPTLEVRGEI